MNKKAMIVSLALTLIVLLTAGGFAYAMQGATAANVPEITQQELVQEEIFAKVIKPIVDEQDSARSVWTSDSSPQLTATVPAFEISGSGSDITEYSSGSSSESSNFGDDDIDAVVIDDVDNGDDDNTNDAYDDDDTDDDSNDDVSDDNSNDDNTDDSNNDNSDDDNSVDDIVDNGSDD